MVTPGSIKIDQKLFIWIKDDFFKCNSNDNLHVSCILLFFWWQWGSNVWLNLSLECLIYKILQCLHTYLLSFEVIFLLMLSIDHDLRRILGINIQIVSESLKHTKSIIRIRNTEQNILDSELIKFLENLFSNSWLGVIPSK